MMGDCSRCADHREAHFLICQNGAWVILEIAYDDPESYEKNSTETSSFKTGFRWAE